MQFTISHEVEVLSALNVAAESVVDGSLTVGLPTSAAVNIVADAAERLKHYCVSFCDLRD